MQAMLLPLHLLVLALTLVGIALADHAALDWFRGKKEMLDARVLRRYHWWVIFGLTGMIVTGALLAWPGRSYYVQNPAFIIKMIFVGVLIVNSFVIGSLMSIASVRSYASLSVREKLPLFVSGAASALCWLGAIVAATML